jgi:uncharacterized membrane protein
MSTASLSADVMVPVLGAALCVTPAVNRPTLQFGVRVPAERSSAPVIIRQRRAYYWRTAAIAVACTAAAIALGGHGSWWLARIILLVEVAADLGCFWRARARVAAAKNAEQWFAGRRQVVATDTSWRTSPPRFPVLWLTPALTVIAASVIIGVLRYPHLHEPAVKVFADVAGQAYVTGLWTGLTLLVYRSRPDIDATDAAAATRRYRVFLTAVAKAVLTLAALADLTLLLAALRTWQVYRPTGMAGALPVLPFAAGLVLLFAVMLRGGQGGYRLSAGGGGPGQAPAAAADRDDDRFWKAGLLYVNREDPSVMVGARFGVGWTLNFGNPLAWLLIAGLVAVVTGLVVIRVAAGL